MFTLPDSLVSEVDNIVKKENSNREDFAKAAFQFYITQKKKIDIKESMIKGYKEMGQINLSLAELGMTNEVSSDDEEGKIAQGDY
jgi:CopG family transcriptional regulator/antitoxin EndoAI